jgi:hypothetical protein
VGIDGVSGDQESHHDNAAARDKTVPKASPAHGQCGMTEPRRRRPQAVALTRGGGQDVHLLDEEEVIEAVAASPVPVLLALGHATVHFDRDGVRKP